MDIDFVVLWVDGSDPRSGKILSVGEKNSLCHLRSGTGIP